MRSAPSPTMSRATAWRRALRLETPAAVGLAASLIGSVFVVLRILVAGTGHVAAWGLAVTSRVDEPIPRGAAMASGVPLHERLLWIGAIVLVLCLAQGIWLGDVGFRSFDDVYLMSWILVFGTGRRPIPLAAVVGLTWMVAAVELVRFL